MFINLLRLAIIFFTFGTVDILDSYTLHSIDDIAYEELTYRDIFQENDFGFYELLNGVKTFEISGNYLIQRINKYKLQESDISINYNVYTNIQVIGFKKNILSNSLIIPDAIENIYLNDLSIPNFTRKENANNPDEPQYHYMWFDYGDSYQEIYLIFPKDTFNSLIEAQLYLKDTIIYYQLYDPIILHTFNNPPTQEELDLMLNYYLINKDNPSFEYTFKTLGIEHLILFTTSMLFWYYSLKLLRKAVK